MKRCEKAVQLHKDGWNCCQAVIGCHCDRFEMTEETAYRLGAFFGGGMRNGEVCGAATGALMALGLAYGDENNRQSTKSQEFLKAFKEEFGTLLCREILAKHEKKMCPELIRFAAKYLEDEFK